MVLTVKHKFNCTIADTTEANNAGQVRPSHWNDDHQLAGSIDLSGGDVTGTLPASKGGTGNTNGAPAFITGYIQQGNGIITGAGTLADPYIVTAAQTLAITSQFSTASATNVLTVQDFELEIV